jgi:cation transport ATPase
MTCGNCVAKVKSELLKIGDVVTADVQLQSPQATISMSKHIATDVLQAAVSKAGNYKINEDSGHAANSISSAAPSEEKTSYFPIFLIFGYITLITVLIQVVKGSFNWMQWMTHFMAGFFLIFSFFKLMNLKGFAEGYRSYDIVAKRFLSWGFIYPFVELCFAILLLTGFAPIIVNSAILLVMSISVAGVIQSLVSKTSFQCACLGTIIKLPLSKVTLFEDLLMIGMSLGMVIAMS